MRSWGEIPCHPLWIVVSPLVDKKCDKCKIVLEERDMITKGKDNKDKIFQDVSSFSLKVMHSLDTSLWLMQKGALDEKESEDAY